MFTSKVPMAKMQKMMHEMHIDDNMGVSSQVILPMIFQNQSFKHSSHHGRRKEYGKRSRFFYHLRQKKKERRLQHGPLHTRSSSSPPPPSHHQQRAPEIEKNNQEQKRENKLITAIVGSSIARNILVKNIGNETNEVRLRFKSGSDCADTLGWLKSSDGQRFMLNVNQLIFILGTNDIHRAGAHETIARIDCTIENIRRLYPGVNIVWQLLQRRTRKTWLLPEGPAVLDEIKKCNVQLLLLASKKKFDTIQPDIPVDELYDGLHPTSYGVRMMETTIRQYLKQNKMVYSSSCLTGIDRLQCDPSLPPLMSIKF